MDFSRIKNLIADLGKTAKKHAPEILTGVGVVGVVSTVALTVKATHEADEALKDEPEDLEPIEKVKKVWKFYIPVAVSTSLTVACIIASNSVSNRRQLALSTACTMTETAFREYKEKVKEELGQKNEKKVEDSISKDAVMLEPLSDRAVVATGHGNGLFFDREYSHNGTHYFYSRRETLERARNNINRRIVQGDMYASVEEYFDEICLPYEGPDVGWNLNNMCEIEFTFMFADDGTPTGVFYFSHKPTTNYREFI